MAPTRRRRRSRTTHPSSTLSRFTDVNAPHSPLPSFARVPPSTPTTVRASSPSVPLASRTTPDALIDHSLLSPSTPDVSTPNAPSAHSAGSPLLPPASIDNAPRAPSTGTPSVPGFPSTPIACVPSTNSASSPTPQQQEGVHTADDTTTDTNITDNFPCRHAEDIFDIFATESLSGMPLGVEQDKVGFGPSPSSDASTSFPEAEIIARSVKKKMTRRTFLGIISLYGNTRYTIENYEHLVAMMADRETGLSLPSPSAMRQIIFPYLIDTLLVKSSIEIFSSKSVDVPEQSSVYNPNNPNDPLEKSRRECVTVLPSSWARMDVQSLHVLRQIACLSNCRCYPSQGDPDIRIESAAVVQNRSDISRGNDSLWINHQGVPVPAQRHMKVTIRTTEQPDVFTQFQQLSTLSVKRALYKNEVCFAFNVRIVATLNVVQKDDCSPQLKEISPTTFTSTDNKQRFDRCLSFLESICRPELPEDPTSTNVATRNRGRRGTAAQAQNTQDSSAHSFQMEWILPADQVTVFSFDDLNDVLGSFICRHWLRRLDDERNFFLFIDVNNNNSGIGGRLTSITVLGVPSLVKHDVQTTQSASNTETGELRECRTTGKLANDETYYMYRLIMYSDDFNARSTLFPKGSVGGLYMMPCGLHFRTRRRQSSIRALSLTPTGVSTNSVLHFILPDIVEASTKGIRCKDALGKMSTVFIDVLGFIGDYPASSSVVDVSGHTSNVPCTHCTFHVNKNPGVSSFAYTTAITSSDAAHRRTQLRMNSIRKVRLGNRQRKMLGLKVFRDSNNHLLRQGPLLRLAALYNDALDAINESSNGTAPALQLHRKDGYAMNMIAPDHLITGLFKGVLTCTFIHLSTGNQTKLQAILKGTLADLSFQTQKCLYLSQQKKLVPGLTMSMLYAILTALPSALQTLDVLRTLPTRKMVLNLHRFFSILFWWPTNNCDGSDAWDLVHGRNIHIYHKSLQVMASNFVKSVNQYSSDYPLHSHLVDRPNTHRILELTAHTIPLYRHVHNVCELVFESAHQPLKFFLSRNHTARSHIHSFHLILARDWLVRIWCLWSIYTSEKETAASKTFALIGLLCLLGGSVVDNVDWSSASVGSEFSDLRAHIEELMTDTVEGRFKLWYGDISTSFSEASFWKVEHLQKKNPLTRQQLSFLSKSMIRLSNLSSLPLSGFQLSVKALFQRGYGSSKYSSHERLVFGDIVQLLVDTSSSRVEFLDTALNANGVPKFYVVGGCILHSSGLNWAVLKECEQMNDGGGMAQLPSGHDAGYFLVRTVPFFQHNNTPLQFVLFSPLIRKVGYIHSCSSQCSFSSATNSVKHCTTTLEGGSFYIFNRRMGYPPRRS